MMIGSEDSRSPLGRPSSLVPPMTLQPLHSMCSGAVSPLQCFPAGVPTVRHCQTCAYVKGCRRTGHTSFFPSLIVLLIARVQQLTQLEKR